MNTQQEIVVNYLQKEQRKRSALPIQIISNFHQALSIPAFQNESPIRAFLSLTLPQQNAVLAYYLAEQPET